MVIAVALSHSDSPGAPHGMNSISIKGVEIHDLDNTVKKKKNSFGASAWP